MQFPLLALQSIDTILEDWHIFYYITLDLRFTLALIQPDSARKSHPGPVLNQRKDVCFIFACMRVVV